MFEFEKRDEGFFVKDDQGRGVAHVTNTRIDTTNDPNFKVQKMILKPLPLEEWEVHFTGRKFTPRELTTFSEELAGKSDDLSQPSDQ